MRVSSTPYLSTDQCMSMRILPEAGERLTGKEQKKTVLRALTGKETFPIPTTQTEIPCVSDGIR